MVPGIHPSQSWMVSIAASASKRKFSRMMRRFASPTPTEASATHSMQRSVPRRPGGATQASGSAPHLAIECRKFVIRRLGPTVEKLRARSRDPIVRRSSRPNRVDDGNGYRFDRSDGIGILPTDVNARAINRRPNTERQRSRQNRGDEIGMSGRRVDLHVVETPDRHVGKVPGALGTMLTCL